MSRISYLPELVDLGFTALNLVVTIGEPFLTILAVYVLNLSTLNRSTGCNDMPLIFRLNENGNIVCYRYK